MLKKLRALLCLFLIASVAAFATTYDTTLSGVINSSAGTALANGSITVALMNCGSLPTTGLVTYPAFTLDGSGNITGTIQSNANTGCSSSASYYQVTAFSSANVMQWRRYYQINAAGSYNLQTATQLSPLPQAVIPGTSPVASVFGRIGEVTAQSGDYTVSQIGGLLDGTGHINSSLLPTLAGSSWQCSGSTPQTCYQVQADGTIIERGTVVALAESATFLVTFPKTFTTSCDEIIVSTTATGAAAYTGAAYVSPATDSVTGCTTTQFTMANSSTTASVTASWIAIGH